VHVLSFDGARLSTPSGMKYRLLALDPYSQHMSLPVLRKIRDLVSAGAIISGAKPTSTPSLSDDPNEFRKITDELWGVKAKENSYGKGKVFGGATLAEVLKTLNIPPDFTFTKSPADTKLLFVHRILKDGDLYFVDNRSDRPESVQATFRVQGKEPELWHADTGLLEPGSFQIAEGRTSVPLNLEPWGTVFAVFRKPASRSSRFWPTRQERAVATVEGPWDVTFQENRGAPAKATFDRLESWSESPDEGVKYFSGTAIYTKRLQAPSNWFDAQSQLWLDLGDVKNLAEISVNGNLLGILWKRPFRIEIEKSLKPGANTLEIKVTNLWVNRMIGDRQPGATKQYTFTNPVFYKANSPLLPSGLLGPVQLIQSRAEQHE
jgi:alpha-L-rhamnosidase